MSDINVNITDEIVNVNVIDEIIEVNVNNAPGIPSGGNTGQVLKKLSNTDYDTYWAADTQGVPYVGATGNVDLGEYELKAGQIEFDQTPTGTAGTAVTRWNDTIGTTETTLKGGNVVLKNGIDLVVRVVNKVSPNATLTKAQYQAVRVTGAQGQRLAVAYAQANNDNNSADTIGLVTENIPTNQEGFIMTVGQLEGINTTGSLQGETWSDGDVLYLSPTTPGAITNIKPVAPQHLVVIGYVEYAHANNGKIYVKVMNGWELGELHDVDTTGAASGQVLKYNGTIWTPQNLLTLTTTGTSGAATLVGSTLNIPNYSTDLSGYVPYTGATGNVDLGYNLISAEGVYIQGDSSTAGGNLKFKQSTNVPTGSAGSTTISTFGTSTMTFSFAQSSGFKVFNFNAFGITTVVAGGRTYNMPDADGTLALTSDILNIYNSNGTLTSNRTLTSGGFNLTFTGSNTASGAIARGLLLNHTLVAAANNDVLVGLDINPTFTIGSFTGLRNFGLRVQNSKVNFSGTYSATTNEGLNPQSFFSINTTFTSVSNAATQYVQISPTINLNTPGVQTAAALYVLPTFQNVGSANTYSIYAGGNNFFGQSGGTTTFSGANVNLLGQGGSATYLNATAPNSQSFRIRVNTTAAELAFQLDGSGNSDVRFLISNTERYRIFNNGNVLIQSGGTFTDAGFRLDVSGTSRLNGSATITGSTTAASAIARGANITSTLVAAANNDVLVGLDITPTFTNGAFTGVSNFAARINGLSQITGNGTTALSLLSGGLQVSRAGISFIDIINSTATKTTFRLASDSTNFSDAFVIRNQTLSGYPFVLFASTSNFVLGGSGTPTDAGFRLDVNGTGRFTGLLTGTTGDFVSTTSATSGSPTGFRVYLGVLASTSTAVYYSVNGQIEYQSSVYLNSTIDGTSGRAGVTAASTNKVNQVTGVRGYAYYAGDLALNPGNTSLYGGRFQSAITGTGYYGHLIGIKIDQPTVNGTADQITGLYIMEQTRSGTGTVTNTSALHIEGAGVENAITWAAGSGSSFNGRLYSPSANNFIWDFTNGINFGSATANTSAKVQIDSTTKGFLPPRMTTTQKNAIGTPATGLVVYDTTLNKLCVYTGAAWETITSA